MTTEQDCRRLDEADALAPLRDRFTLHEDVIYLDGNSLGVTPKDAVTRAQEVIEQEWGTGLIRSWNTADWWNLPIRLGDRIAPLVGAGPGETVVADTTSVNLFKVLANAMRIQHGAHPQKKVILAERDAFPTDLYMIEGFNTITNRGFTLKLVDEPTDLDGLVDADTAVVVLSHVNYRTGYLYDMAATNRLLHERGALVIWDVCHSIGAVPIDFKSTASDFAIGCTYKYLNGGPGSPAMLWANPEYRDQFWQPLSGWWGHATPFAMQPSYRAARGVRSYLCGTQPILSMSLIACSLDIFKQTSIGALRKKSLALTDLFITLMKQECGKYPLTLITPVDHAHRGSHVSFRHPEGFAVMQALISHGVIGDYREPEVMRFAVTPLYMRFMDIWNAVQVLKNILDHKEWDQPKFRQRGEVT